MTQPLGRQLYLINDDNNNNNIDDDDDDDDDDDTFQFCWYLQETPGEHTYLPKKIGIFLVRIVRSYDVFVLQK